MSANMHPLALKVQAFLDTLPTSLSELEALVRAKGIRSPIYYDADSCPMAILIREAAGVAVAVLPRHTTASNPMGGEGPARIHIMGDGDVEIPNAVQDFANNFDQQIAGYGDFRGEEREEYWGEEEEPDYDS